jgi:hypothetical protein
MHRQHKDFESLIAMTATPALVEKRHLCLARHTYGMDLRKVIPKELLAYRAKRSRESAMNSNDRHQGTNDQ